MLENLEIGGGEGGSTCHGQKSSGNSIRAEGPSEAEGSPAPTASCGEQEKTLKFPLRPE